VVVGWWGWVVGGVEGGRPSARRKRDRRIQEHESREESKHFHVKPSAWEGVGGGLVNPLCAKKPYATIAIKRRRTSKPQPDVRFGKTPYTEMSTISHSPNLWRYAHAWGPGPRLARSHVVVHTAGHNARPGESRPRAWPGLQKTAARPNNRRTRMADVSSPVRAPRQPRAGVESCPSANSDGGAAPSGLCAEPFARSVAATGAAMPQDPAFQALRLFPRASRVGNLTLAVLRPLASDV